MTIGARCTAALVALPFLLPATAPAYAADRALCETISWDRLPTAEDMTSAYPKRAALRGIEGSAVLQCGLAIDGALANCSVETEAPLGAEFGAAALALATKIRAAPACRARPDASAKALRIPLSFRLPPGPPYREALFKQPSFEYRWLAPAGPFWPEAAVRLGGSGVVIADCSVGPQGELTDCKIAEESDPRFGFGDAVRAMARRRWMTAAPIQDGVKSPVDNVWRFRVDFGMHKRTVSGGHPVYAPLQADVR